MGVEAETSAQAASAPGHPDSWVWFDGELRRYHDVSLGLMTHALHYGTGCFEGIRAYWNSQREQLFLLQPQAHFERLRRSARVLRMEVPLPTEELVAVTAELLRRNDFRADTYIRPLMFVASEEIGVRLTGLRHVLAIYASPFGKYIETDKGIRCQVSTWRRVSDQSVPARAKITGAYVNSALVKSEAMDAGYDEAIVLTMDGHVSEGSAENVFMLKDGAFVTPPVTDDILEGITRKLMIRLIRDELGMPVLERSIDRTELYTCDELFLCGTGAEISPVVELDLRQVGDGRVGEFTQELQQIYFSAVRGDHERYSDWSVPVY